MHPNAGRPVAMNGGKAILWLKDGQATPFFKRIRAMSDVAAFKGRDEPCLQKGSQNQSKSSLAMSRMTKPVLIRTSRSLASLSMRPATPV